MTHTGAAACARVAACAARAGAATMKRSMIIRVATLGMDGGSGCRIGPETCVPVAGAVEPATVQAQPTG